MATHELYIGGPSRSDGSRHQFPRPTFSDSGAVFKEMVPAAHKGPTQYALTRVLDLGYSDGVSNDSALRAYFSNHTVATGDVLDLVVVPANTVLYGVAVNVVAAAGGATTTATVSVGGTAITTAIDLTATGAGFAPVTTATAAAPVTSGAVDLSKATFNTAPQMVAITLAFSDVADLNGMRLEVSPLVSACFEGQF